MRRVTLQDVADRAGCTAPAVSYVLGGGPMSQRFRPELRERIREAASVLGYRANAAARAVATGRFKNVTLLMGVDADRSPVPAGLIHGVMDELTAQRYSLTVARMSDERLGSDDGVPQIVSQLASDGVLMDYNSDIPAGLVAVVKRHRIPTVWINADVETDAVRPDDFGGAKALTEAMLSAGHRRIVFAHGSYNRHYSVQARYNGYAAAMADAGLRPVRRSTDGGAFNGPVFGGPVFDGGAPTGRVAGGRAMPGEQCEDVVRRWLTAGPAPTAVVCYGGEDVWTVRLVARMLGMRIPDDLLISPFGAWGSRRVEFGFDAIRAVVPEYDVGRRAVGALLTMIDSGESARPAVVVPMSLEGPMVGPTTGASGRGSEAT